MLLLKMMFFYSKTQETSIQMNTLLNLLEDLEDNSYYLAHVLRERIHSSMAKVDFIIKC